MSTIKLKSKIDVECIQAMGGDHMVIAAAKVSVSGLEARKLVDSRAEDNAGLIRYLIRQRHGTPFEHSAITFFVHAPIFVWREWHRHRVGFSYNEESGRYKQLEPVFYIPEFSRPMMKVEDWKAGRPKFDICTDRELFDRFVARKVKQYTSAYESYEQSLKEGFDPGLARIDLPVGIYSGCWVTCNPRSLMHFLSLRVHDDAAKFVSYPLHEIELAARACEEIFSKGWPITYTAFNDNGRVAP